MKKIMNICLKIFLVISSIAIIYLAFFGVYKKEDGKFVNMLPKYKYTDIFGNYTEIILKPDSGASEKDVFVDEAGLTVREVPQTDKDEKTGVPLPYNFEEIKGVTLDEEVKKYKIEKRVVRKNDEKLFNKEQYEKSIETLNKYLKAQGIASYNVRKDLNNGTVIFEIPQMEGISEDYLKTILTVNGKFEIKDKQTGKVYLNEKNIKDVKLFSHPTYGTIINIEFTENGKKILEAISEKYKTVKNEQGQDISQKLSIYISGNKYLDQSFAEKNTTGTLQLQIGGANITNKEIRERTLQSASILQQSLKLGATDLEYKIEDTNIIDNHINEKMLKNVIILAAAVCIILALTLVIFFGGKGIFSAIMLFAYLGVVLLVIRYTNIQIAVSSLVALAIIYIMEFALLFMVNKEIKHDEETKEKDEIRINIFKNYAKILKETIILLIIAVVLSFASIIEFSSFAMIIFIGIIIHIIYNEIFIKKLLK